MYGDFATVDCPNKPFVTLMQLNIYHWVMVRIGCNSFAANSFARVCFGAAPTNRLLDFAPHPRHPDILTSEAVMKEELGHVE